MNKKNTYIYISLILLCIAATPSFYLFSSYRSAEKRGSGYLGPRRIRQQPKKRVTQAQQPIQTNQQIPTPVAAPITIDQTNQNIQQPTTEPTTTSDAMQAKAATSSPGWLMTAYIVFLSTLNKAFGAGVEQSYKPLLGDFKQRQAFLALKDDAQNKATKMVQSGDFAEVIHAEIEHLKKMELSPTDPRYSQRNKRVNELDRLLISPQQEQINSLTKDLLKENKIDADKMEQQVSFGSMAKDAAYLTLFNTATRVIGGLIGFGATMLLQSLVPTQGQ